jgi:TetR/AcrR family tetracycline transcriptional repressor
MSIVPYRKSEGRRRRRTLDQPQVVSAALSLLDEVGLEELTMRRLAERLGVQAASLYRHVRDKEELLLLLGDEISGEIPLVGSDGGWREQLTEIARNVRQGLRRHRDAARVLAATAPFGPRRLRHIESFLRVLRSAGLSAGDAARVGYHCNNFVTEFVADETRFDAMLAAPGVTRRKLLADARRHFKSLPPAEYPTLIELADELTADDSDGLFDFGLAIWLDAIERLAQPFRRRSGRRSS